MLSLMKKIVFMLLFCCSTVMAKNIAIDGVVPFDVSKAGSVSEINIHVSWFTKQSPRIVVLSINPPGNNWKDVMAFFAKS